MHLLQKLQAVDLSTYSKYLHRIENYWNPDAVFRNGINKVGVGQEYADNNAEALHLTFNF